MGSLAFGSGYFGQYAGILIGVAPDVATRVIEISGRVALELSVGGSVAPDLAVSGRVVTGIETGGAVD